LASKGLKKVTLALSGRDSSVKAWGVDIAIKKTAFNYCYSKLLQVI
jgi:hypothetical protein